MEQEEETPYIEKEHQGLTSFYIIAPTQGMGNLAATDKTDFKLIKTYVFWPQYFFYNKYLYKF